MNLKALAVSSVLAGVATASMSMRAAPAGSDRIATFNRDVLPILQKNCQTCHRPGEVAPMSFLTYKDTRPYARAMKTAVAKRQMPPWFADPAYGHFSNDKRLSDSDIQTIAAWADGGAPEGDENDRPAPIVFQDGWGLKPEIVIEMPKDIDLPATGTINYKLILVKANFQEDMWVVAADLRPGNPQAVHHMRAIVRPPDSDWMKDAEPGVAYEAGDAVVGRQGEGSDLLGKFNPGLGAQDFSEFESAKFVPKGSDIVFNMHYTATGKPTTDRSRLALVFSKEPPKKRYFTHDGPTAFNLAIPAGDGNAEVVSEMTATADTQLVYVQPHMHLRGKDYEVRLIYPSGKMETVFKAKWDFNWQLGYDFVEPIPIPKGTRIVGIAHFDNSTANKYNPDPMKLVFWGPQNWEEMQNCFMSFLIDPNLKDPKTLFRPSGPSALPRGTSGPTLAALVRPSSGTK
jgi:mono/diheme cytochrome c family protein